MNKKILLLVEKYIDYTFDNRKLLILNLSTHIDTLNSLCIIHYSIRNKVSNKLYTILNNLNNCYNLCKSVYSDFDNIKLSNQLIEYFSSLTSDAFNFYMTYNNINNLASEINVFFDDIDNNILQIMSVVGTKAISDLLALYYGKYYVDDFKNNILLELLCEYFVPVEIVKILNNQDKIEITKNVVIFDDKLTEEDNNFKFEMLLENNYKIKLKIRDNVFEITGYFIYDSLNILSSRYNFVNEKKNSFFEYARDNIMCNKDYRDSFINNLNIGDILCFNNDDLNNEITQYYDLYTKYSNLKFKDTITSFLKESLINKYKMCKCLLLGNKNAIKYGSFLFGTTRDQNRNTKNNNALVADIIFRNLNSTLQNKLRKTGQCVKQELDRIKKISMDDMDLKQQCIMNNNISDHVKKCILTKLDEMKANNSEYHKNLLYVKTLLDYPWIPKDFCDIFSNISSNNNKCREKLKEIREEFDKKVFGQTEFKTVIGDIVGKWMTNPNSMGKAIGLCGPPGCGKTLIASGLGQVLGIPYQEIHLGGLEDGSVLNGHSFTYSGAQPGLIVTKMTMTGSPRCILFFDELDKACVKHGVNEIYNVLIHATDPNTNNKFSDKFFQDVTFELGKCIFIFSFNDASKIDPILKDRMEIINVSPYSMTDKVLITKKYLMVELLKGINIENGSVKISDELITYIINNYTMEAGVRTLKNNIEKIFLKLNIDRINNTGAFKNKDNFSKTKPIVLNKTHINTYLGKPKAQIEKIHNTNQVGVINGLYATSAGSGGIIPILVYPLKNNSNKFKLELTGKQGDVMKESVYFAWTLAKNCVKKEILNNFYKTNPSGIHIHTFDLSTPKQGPSACSVFLVALISRITNYPIKKDIAMTGELSINGLVTAIGGLEHKLNGAKHAGIKLVFVGSQNLDDVKKIKETNPELFELLNPWNNNNVASLLNNLKKNKVKNSCDNFKLIVVNDIYEIIPFALIDGSKSFVSTYDISCDTNNFMNKNISNGFSNNDNIIIDNNDSSTTSIIESENKSENDDE